MKVRMKVDISGTLNGEPWPRIGRVGEVPDLVGAKLCAAGQAEPVGTRAVETTTVTEPVEERDETAAEDQPKRRGRPPKAKTDDGD